MATSAEILASANIVNEQLIALNSDITQYRSELDALSAEDPCGPGFLDRVKALNDKGELYTQKRDEFLAQYNQLEKDYSDLSFLEKLSSSYTPSKDAIAKIKAQLVQMNNNARAFGGPAKRKALEEANAKCSTDAPENKKETPTDDTAAAAAAAAAAGTTANDDAASNQAENKQPSDAAAENSGNSSSQAIASGTTSGGTQVNADGQKSASGESQTTSSGAPITPASSKYPGKRKDNPLSKLSSYVYSISLYMVTPEAMNKFIANGGSLSTLKGKNSGVYVVAQSGGINSEFEDRLLTLDGSLGKGKPGYDYYIDDLNITTLLPGGANRATTSTEIKFKIVEPMSFTFLQDIAKASAALNATSDLVQEAIKNGQAPNGFKQHYILGIKFYGYDVDGNIVSAGNPIVAGYDNGGTDGDRGALIQRYFAIKFSNMKFTLDGKMVTYNCEALVISEHAAYGQINGSIKKQLTITAGTIGEALNGGTGSTKGLSQILNEDIVSNKDRQLIDIDNQIKFEFLDDQSKPVTDHPIAKAGLIDDSTFVADTAPMIKSSRTDKVTIADSFKAVSFDKNKKQITVTAGEHILTVVDNIIVKSNYITNALKQTMSQTAEAKTIQKPVTSTLKWYSVNPYIQIKPWDKKTNNWSYDITYQITEYDVPYIRSPLAGVTSKYPGPFKFYEYLLTGKNSEIISYTQQYDNLFYTVASMSTTPDFASTAAKGSAPVSPQNTSNSDPNSGGQNKGSEINNNVRAQLYSPGDQSQAKIKILGDPDYIMTTIGVKATSASKFYGADTSINPTGGQTFIQVVFNTASDYMNDGLLDVSDELQFYKTDRVKKAGIDGIVYMVVQVDSVFSKGSFLQTLDCLMVDETLLVTGESKSGESSAASSGGEDPNQSAAETRRLSASPAVNAKTAPVSNKETIGADGGANTPVVNLSTNNSSTGAIATEVRTERVPFGNTDEGKVVNIPTSIMAAAPTPPSDIPNNDLTEGNPAVLDDRILATATQVNDDYLG